MLNFGHKIPNRFKLQWGFIFTAILVLLVPFFAHYLNDDAAYASVFVILCFIGVVHGILQATSLSTASILPPKYTGVVMSGNGLAGVLACIVNLIILLVVPRKGFSDAIVFFGIHTIIVIVSGIAYPYCIESDFYKYYEKLAAGNESEDTKNS